MNPHIAVFGAAGHTGRFVSKELHRRGLVPVLVGRDPAKLEALRASFPDASEVEIRVGAVDDPKSLDRALSGVAAVINCAGPFLDTAHAVAHAAIRARAHYLDVTAEQAAAQATLDEFAAIAEQAKLTVVPAAAFYGGLADLLATAAAEDATAADEIDIAIALDGWWPTLGTRVTGRRNTARRFAISGGAKSFLPDLAPRRTWTFPEPFGAQDMVELPFSEIVTISHHLTSREIHSYINLAPLADLRDPNTPPPRAADANGRSAQRFSMDVAVRVGSHQRRATATGTDIYAFSAPLVVEAAQRIVEGRAERTGAAALGQLFDARDFLQALAARGEVLVDIR